MKQIEKAMINAIRERKNWRNSNTAVDVAFGGIIVTLHGNNIFAIHPDGKKEFTLAGWNTSTTRSRLRALGVNVSQRDWSAYYNGKHINVSEWYEI